MTDVFSDVEEFIKKRRFTGKMSTKQVDQRLHPGVIASVVFVALSAIIAAVLIIRKYCFPRSETSYRYSVLRRMEMEEEGERGTHTVGEDSDEDLLE